MDILVLPLRWFGDEFISHPWIALFPALIFFLLYRHKRRRWVLAASVCWFAYTLYEYAMTLKLICDGECNIRVDLVLIYPLLIVVSVIALSIYVKSILGRRENRSWH